MEFSTQVFPFFVVVMVAALGVRAESLLAPVSPTADWQMNRLMAPTSAQIAAEGRGRVVIYDSLTIHQVNAAMNRDFDRIENMMFIRIHHPPDTADGEVEVEDDDC